MGLFSKVLDKEKTQNLQVATPQEIMQELLRGLSGSELSRQLKYNIFYKIVGFQGVVDGLGTSTIVANTAVALASLGLDVCVIDTSIMYPCQDILLKTREALNPDFDKSKIKDWFDMARTTDSVLHQSTINGKLYVLSFYGRGRTLVDALSINDDANLVDLALTQLDEKFDIILIDMCKELTSINTACIQRSQRIVQVWNDNPSTVDNIERFIQNNLMLSAAIDKMANVIYSKIVPDTVGGGLEAIRDKYRLKCLAEIPLSYEVQVIQNTRGLLWQAESTDPKVIEYTASIIKVVAFLANIKDNFDKVQKGELDIKNILKRDKTDTGKLSVDAIAKGEVEGTALHKMNQNVVTADNINVATTLEEADKQKFK